MVLVALALLSCVPARAQFTIKKHDDNIQQLGLFNNDLSQSVKSDYFDQAQWRDTRRKQRKERNTLEFNAKLESSLQQFENWTAGGNNTFSALSTIYFRHQYKRNKFNTDAIVNARYGLNVIDDKPFKNVDEFKISYQVAWSINQNWSYSTTANIRSQFAIGYKSRTDQTKLSAFMAPGYLDLSIGVTFSNKKSPFKITLSPISGNMVAVLDPEVSQLGKYGVAAGEKVLNQLGPSVNIFFDKSFGKQKKVRYRTTLYTFSNLEVAPTVRWTNNIDISVSKYLSIAANGILYYFKPASTAIQYQYSFTVGLAYSFKNK